MKEAAEAEAEAEADEQNWVHVFARATNLEENRPWQRLNAQIKLIKSSSRN